jgi:hypothetical protein
MARRAETPETERGRRSGHAEENRGHVTETLTTFRRYHRALPARDRWLFNLSAAGCAYCLWLSVAFVDPRLLLEIGVILWAARTARERRLNRGDDGHEHEDWIDY